MEFNESSLGRKYLKFCELRNHAIKTGKMDLSGIEWFYPTNILPLGIFIKEQQNISVIPPIDPNVLMYYDIITKGERGYSSGRSYIPIVQIPPNDHQRGKILEPLYTFENGHVGGHNAFSYFTSELVDNVYQHSKFSTAYIMAQKYAKFTEVGIIDNGISIPRAFENAGFAFDDTKALSEAINGLSTKPDAGRGFGLKTSLKLLTKGLRGECLIISGGGGLIATDVEKTFYKMHDYYAFGGTLICASVPYTYSRVNIYDYIE